MITNVKVYDMNESIKASKYPMSIDIESLSCELTNTTKKLGRCNKGEGHDNFLKGILVSFDLTFTNKAWVEMERYNFITFVSSQSTMHRLKSFELDKQYADYVDNRIIDIMKELQDTYNKTKSKENYLKLLYSNPCGFKLTARLTTNYCQLKTIYSQRKTHRLPEWRDFCDWIEGLPNFKELTGI
ncbi:hypothetical protein [Vallitalea sp.]|jgi:hypothetical protein|uniref:hypothetical protein n=1 Tax=Vallitalea sp. TaxID=1882829 RepID=UPI002600AD1E|nr:hypothetical protein [Vallitalea sp.]MCT4687009.1 hypothetical protein [Vallitalea sp.]